jgi:hypothetical protein
MFISLDQISWRHATKSASDPTSEFLEAVKVLGIFAALVRLPPAQMAKPLSRQVKARSTRGGGGRLLNRSKK